MADSSHYPLMSPFTSHRDYDNRRGNRLGFGGDRFKAILYDSIVPKEISGCGSLCGDPRLSLQRAKYKEGLRTVLEAGAASRGQDSLISERFKNYREAVRFRGPDCKGKSSSSSSSNTLQVRTMDWSPEGTKILFNLDDGSLKLYDVNGLSNGPVARWDEGKSNEEAHRVGGKFLAESSLVATISGMGKFQVLDTRCNKQHHSVALTNTKKEMRDFIGLKASKVMPEIALLTANGNLFVLDRRMPSGFVRESYSNNSSTAKPPNGSLRMHGNTIGGGSANGGSGGNTGSSGGNRRSASRHRSPRNDRNSSTNSSDNLGGDDYSSGNSYGSSSGIVAAGWNDVRISLVRQAQTRHYQQQVNSAHSLGVVRGNGMRPEAIADERSDPRSRRNMLGNNRNSNSSNNGHPYSHYPDSVSTSRNSKTRSGSSRRKELRHRCRFVDRSLWSDDSDDEFAIRDDRARRADRERGERRNRRNSQNNNSRGSQNSSANGTNNSTSNSSGDGKDGSADDKTHVEYPFNLDDAEADDGSVKNIQEKINDFEYIGSQLFMACQGKSKEPYSIQTQNTEHAPGTLSVFRDANFSHRIDIPNAHGGGLVTLCGHTGPTAMGKCGAYNGGYGGDIGSYGGEEAFLGDEDDYFGGLHQNAGRNRLGSTDSAGDSSKKDSGGKDSNIPATVDCISAESDGKVEFPYDPNTSADRIFFNRSCEVNAKGLSYSGRTLAVNDALAGDGMNRGYALDQHLGLCGGPSSSMSTNPHGIANEENKKDGKSSKDNSKSNSSSTAKKFLSYYCPGGGGRTSMAASDLSTAGQVTSGNGGSYFTGNGGFFSDPWCPYDDQNPSGQQGFGFCGGFESFGGGSNNNAAGGNSGILVTTGMDCLIKVWNLRTFEQINSFCCSLDTITTMDLSHDCGLLAFGCGGSPGNLYKVPKSEKSNGSSRYTDDYSGSGHGGSGDSKYNLTIVDPWTGEIMIQSQLDLEKSPSIVKWHPWRNVLCLAQETKFEDADQKIARAPVQILKVPEY